MQQRAVLSDFGGEPCLALALRPLLCASAWASRQGEHLAQLLNGFVEVPAFGGVPHCGAVQRAVEQLVFG